MNNKVCLLYGYFGHNNLGDDLLFEEALSNISQEYDIYVIGQPFYYNTKRKITFITAKQSRLIKKDLIVYAGGGLFPSKSYSFRGFLGACLIFLRSKCRIIEGVGIVPKHDKNSKIWFHLFLKMFNYISVRDRLSLDYIKSLGNLNAINCHDLYFGHKINVNETKHLTTGAIICLANPFSTEEKKNHEVAKRYSLFVSQMQRICVEIKKRFGPLTFLPFFLGSDENLIKDVLRNSDLSDSKVLTYGKDFSIDSIDEIFGKFGFALCMRFHSIVLSIRNIVPSLCICYDYKSSQLLSESGLSKIGLKYGIREDQFFGEKIDLDDQELGRVFNYTIDEYDNIKSKMNKARYLYYNQVQSNYEMIRKLICTQEK